MNANTTKDPVGKAVADIKKAVNRLIKLLASEDESVGLRAAAALREVDPPPIWALTDVLIQASDTGLRLKIVAVLGRIAQTEQIRVLGALGSAYLTVKDLDVRMALIDAMLGMKTIFEQAAQAPAPGAAPRGESPPSTVEDLRQDSGAEPGRPAWRRPGPRSGV